MKLSIIVPCYNSMPILKTMVSETIREIEKIPVDDYEIILVNDCSPKPETIGFLKEIADTFGNIKVVDLARNGGQANAQVAALHYVTGDAVLNMDDDMQTHPKNIPLLFQKFQEGYDLVIGKYPHKRHSFYRRVLTKMDDRFETVFLKKPKDISFTSFWLVRRYITDEIIKYNAPYSFMEGLFLRTAGKIANVEVEHFERQEGTSGYNFGKLVKLWSNFTGFTVLPLRISGFVGIIAAACAVIWAIVLIIKRIAGVAMPSGYTSLMCMLLLAFGVIMACIGLLGEYVGRVFMVLNQTPQFVLKEVYEGKGARETDE